MAVIPPTVQFEVRRRIGGEGGGHDPLGPCPLAFTVLLRATAPTASPENFMIKKFVFLSPGIQVVL